MPLPDGCPSGRPPSPEVTEAICLVPSAPFSQSPWYARPVHLCRFRVRSIRRGCFPERSPPPGQSDKAGQKSAFVTSARPRNIDLVPIDYGFRPRLRGRLTLRGLALRRNPWTFGASVSHARFATHVSIRTSDGSTNVPTSASQPYGTLRYHGMLAHAIRSFGAWLEPRYIFGAGRLLDQ